MVNLLCELSRYVLAFLMCIYVLVDVAGIFRWHMRLYGGACVLLFLLHLVSFLVLIARTGEASLKAEIALFYGVQAAFLVIYPVLYRRLYKGISSLLLNNACMLLCVGFIIQTRLSLTGGTDRALRQYAIALLSAVVTLVVPCLMEHFWQLYKFSWLYAATGFLLLLFVFLMGTKSYGAALSLAFGGISFQPLEIVKVTFVLFCASMFYNSAEGRTVVAVCLVAAAHILVLALSNDLGGALILFVTTLALLYTATADVRYLGGGLVLAGAGAALCVRLFAHVRRRVLAWVDPWSDIDNAGYQVAQSLFAIGTGGWFGLGLLGGVPGKIPVVEKDFVFSAVCEEFGVLFGLGLLFICLGCFVQFMGIASRMQASFYRLAAVGLAVEYIMQVFLSVGGAVKFIPSTGVTVPFVSYGGSSLFATFLLFGIIQGLYMIKTEDEKETEVI